MAMFLFMKVVNHSTGRFTLLLNVGVGQEVYTIGIRQATANSTLPSSANDTAPQSLSIERSRYNSDAAGIHPSYSE